MRRRILTAVIAMSLLTEPPTGAEEAAGPGEDTAHATPEAGGPRRLQVSAEGGQPMREAPQPDAAVIATLADGAVLSNLGCTTGEGAPWCAVEPFRGGQRGYVTADALRPAHGPDGTVPLGPDDSALRAGQGDFDAIGTIACAQRRGQPMGTCRFGVARAGGGDATIVATFSNGFSRILSFTHGEFVGANTTMSGTGRDIDWERDGDLHRLRVDDQRYELPDAVLSGR